MIPKCILLQVVNSREPQEQVERNMMELEQLVATFGGTVVDRVIQHKVHPDPSTYIGAGKLDWLVEQVKELKIDIVVLNAVVNSGQLFRLEKELWKVNTQIKVWDRVDLILNIFDKHASTREAKLQIELARIQHTGPRIYGLGKTELSRQGGGIGTRGLGETNIERERRTMKKLQQKIKKELKEHSRDQLQRIKQRQQKGIKTIALVGYTSAGKTTLFNALTKKIKETQSGLFTTLDSVVGKLKVTEYDPGILISDTIGFIDELPPVLVTAFKSTLLESLQARLLLHVVDASDADSIEKITVVEDILSDLGVTDLPILIFNKIDVAEATQLENIEQRFFDREHYEISAKTNVGVPELKKILTDKIN
jgi:GTP-binding protein HflX